MLDPVDLDIADSDFLKNQCDGYESSDSEIDSYCMAYAVKNRLFGRQKPLHVVLGGGLCMLFVVIFSMLQISSIGFFYDPIFLYVCIQVLI